MENSTGIEKRAETLAHNPVAEHECDGFDCYLCTKTDIDAATAKYEARQTAKRVINPRRRKSATEDARPVAARTVNGVAGDVPPAQRLYEFSSPKGSIQIIISSDGTSLLRANDNSLTESTAAIAQDIVNGLSGQVERGENCMTGGEVKEFSKPQVVSPTPLQPSLDNIGPAHLSQVTVAKGFILAGNAYFTVRSTKTGVRYTYRVNRARCQRCQKTDCACFAHPSYFVSLLTGPDNTGDYTYLGMIRYGSYSNGGSATHYAWEFKATRATGNQATGKPFAAFRYVWERLNLGRMPENCEVWHEGRCGRCGRRLTVPSSIEMGIGPECAAKGGL